jgi:putative NADPH-quinone reductase
VQVENYHHSDRIGTYPIFILMDILQIIAHPAVESKSFTSQLAEAFRDGAEKAGHQVRWYNLFHPDASEVRHREIIAEVDHLCFAWPCMWEMPPAKLVDFFQTTFVKDFAFHQVGDRMVPLLNIPVTCLISMGQQKPHNTVNLHEAMIYCGLHPTFCIFNNVGPRMSPELAASYLDLAYRQGLHV